MKPTNFPRRMNAKRTVALQNLEAQLLRVSSTVPTPAEQKVKRTRIESEIKILKTRITA